LKEEVDICIVIGPGVSRTKLPQRFLVAGAEINGDADTDTEADTAQVQCDCERPLSALYIL